MSQQFQLTGDIFGYLQESQEPGTLRANLCPLLKLKSESLYSCSETVHNGAAVVILWTPRYISVEQGSLTELRNKQ